MTIPGSSPPHVPRHVRDGAFARRRARGQISADPPGLITIAALEGADPIPATWAALLLAVAPAPLALVVAFAPVPVARLAAPLAVVVLVVGIIGQVTHTGLFFVPALAAMTVAAVRLWRERG